MADIEEYQVVERLSCLIFALGEKLNSDLSTRIAKVQSTVSIVTTKGGYLIVNIGCHLDRI